MVANISRLERAFHLETLFLPPHPLSALWPVGSEGAGERVGFGCRTFFVNPSGVRTDRGREGRVTSSVALARGKTVEAMFTMTPEMRLRDGRHRMAK